MANNSSSSHRKSKKGKRHRKSHKSEKSHRKYKKAKKRRHQSCSSLNTSEVDSHSDSENIPEKTSRISGTLNRRFTALARIEDHAKKTAKNDVYKSTTDPEAVVKEITKNIQSKIQSTRSTRTPNESSSSDAM